MEINLAGLKLIKRFEGFRSKAYICPAGVLTIGYGSTGSRVTSGLTISRQKAEEWLKQDCQKFENVIKDAVKVPLTSNQFSALVSFVYNVGGGAFRNSTLLRKLNNKDYNGACAELDRWVKGGGVVLPGLVKRRDAEQLLFKTPDVSTPTQQQENNIVSSNRIRITKNSWLKTSTISNAQLKEPDEKIQVFSNTELPFLACKAEGGHTRFTFGKSGEDIKIGGKNTWLIWNEHFELIEQPSSSSDNKSTTLVDQIVNACEEKGYPLKKDEYNLVAISGLSPTPNRKEGYGINTSPDKWNDSVLVIEWDGSEWDALCFYRATTEPGVYYVNNPLNRNGSAVLDWGLHKDLWRFGRHRRYEALVQAGVARLIRDHNKNHKRDDTISHESGNGVNLHTTKTTGWRGSFNSNSIGQWSAGVH